LNTEVEKNKKNQSEDVPLNKKIKNVKKQPVEEKPGRQKKPNKHSAADARRKIDYPNSDRSQADPNTSMKKTSPDILVKTESFRRKLTKLDSQGLSRRMKPQTVTKSENLLNLRKPTAEMSRDGWRRSFIP
jgi:hypothetical protein